MSLIDPYSLCIGGTGKKIKFCECCKDAVHELDVILRTLEGEQRLVALEKIQASLKKHPHSAALMMLRSRVLLELGQNEEAIATAHEFVEKFPDNPVALALLSLSEIVNRDTTAAVKHMQQSMSASKFQLEEIQQVALRAVIETALGEGKVLAARAHLMLEAALSGNEGQYRAGRMLMRIDQTTSLPLIFKEEPTYAPCPEGYPHEKEFEEALDLADSGRWLKAADRFEILAEKTPQEPEVLENLAILRGWLGDDAAMTKAWRNYAQLPQIHLEEAVEAEAMAQEVDPDYEPITLERMAVTYHIENVERMGEALSACPTAAFHKGRVKMPEGEPAPKAVYHLLDRPELKTAEESLSLDEIPIAHGPVMLFGRETDRPPRVEIQLPKNESYNEVLQRMQELFGAELGSVEKEESIDQIGLDDFRMNPRWYLPEGLSLKAQKRLRQEQHTRAMSEIWRTIPNPILGGKTPEEAAGEEKYKIPLLAVILLMELRLEADYLGFEFDQLREKLGLPKREVIDPAEADLEALSLVELSQIDVSKLNDEDLINLTERARTKNAAAALRNFAGEILRRPALEDHAIMAHEALAEFTRDDKEALEHIAAAGKIAEAEGESAGPYLVREIDLRLSRACMDETPELLQKLQTRYKSDDMIQTMLAEVLMKHGIIGPDGRFLGPSPTAASAPTSPASEPAPSAIWTPGQQGPQEEKKLWLPGT